MNDLPKRRSRSARRREKGARVPTLADRLEYAALGSVAGLLGWLGIDRASALMGRTWRLAAPFNKRHARADAHLAAAMPELSPAERRAILGDMWENLGRTAAETLLLPRLLAEPDRFEIVAPDVDAEATQAGAVFASLHMGNWELGAVGLRLAGFKVAAVYQQLSNPLAEAFLRARREPVYDAGLFPREAASALKLRSLARTGAAVGVLADLRDATGIVVPFFGRPAYANTLPALLARRLSLPMICGRVVRTGGARFRMEAVPIEVPRTGDVEADVAAATATLNARFEAWIRETPSQWMWAHRKWRDAL